MIINDKPVVMVFPSYFADEIDGSHARAASLLNRLASEFSHVIVYSHKNHPSHPWSQECLEVFRDRWPDVSLVVEDLSPVLARAAAIKNLLISLFPRLSLRILRITVPGSAKEFERIRKNAGAFLISYKFSMSEINGLDPSICIVDTHDLLCLKWAKLTNTSPVSISALRRMRGEIAALDTTGGVVAISPSEASFFRMMLEKAKTYYVSSWEQAQNKAVLPIGDEYVFDLIFVASGYEMNVRGFTSLLRRHGEWLARYRIAVCGQVCDDPAVIEIAAKFPLITLLGFVDQIDQIYAATKAGLAPVDGTGLKMKIVSALQYGLPSFVSEQAFDGLPHGYEGAIFGIDEPTLRSVLTDPDRLGLAHKQALAYYSSFNAMSESDATISAIKTILNQT